MDVDFTKFPLNMMGGLQELENSSGNKETIETINRLTEEFYKTIGILLFVRYSAYIKKENKNIDEKILLLINDYFSEPSFDSWMKLGSLCGEILIKENDIFTRNFISKMNTTLDPEMGKNAKLIISDIYNLRSSPNVNCKKYISRNEFLEIIRLLRNFRSHEWDNNELLDPLIKNNIKEFVIEQFNLLFNDIQIDLIKPISIKKESIESIICKNGRKSKCEVKLDYLKETYPMLETTYINYNLKDTIFNFPTNLIEYNQDENRIFVFTKMKNKNEAIFENLPLSGGIKKMVIKTDNLMKIFNLEINKEIDNKKELLIQKFGTIRIEKTMIHNMPEKSEIYVNRPIIENQLLEKLSHKRLYMTTLDGGGGFGKTELAKNVIWRIINSEIEKTFPIQFDLIIWITGKIDYFEKGRLVTKDQYFNTLEDLLDCILYTTGNINKLSTLIDNKKESVIEIFNNYHSILIVLDNLETVSQKDIIWEYLIYLGNKVSSNLKILITSRTRGGYADQRLNIRAMEKNEAEQLINNEFNVLDVPQNYRTSENINDIIELTGSIPLVIKYSIELLVRGYNLKELKDNMPKESEKALDFICSFQWNELSMPAKKLLMGISFCGGKITFAQAKLLCNFFDEEFYSAKEQLQDRSFLIDSYLIESILYILPPINKFANMKLKEFPEIKDELLESHQLIMTSSDKTDRKETDVLPFSDEVALNQIFQRADLLIKRGAIEDAYKWYQQAVKRFPESVLSWKAKGDFEFRYNKDEDTARNDFEKAIKLNPKDPSTLKALAYWEYNIGIENLRKSNLKDAIKLNETAIKLINPKTDFDDILKTRDFIVSALMKLAYFERDEGIRTTNKKCFEIKDTYFKNAIEILINNLYDTPKSYEQKKHNVIDYNNLANAYLMMGSKYDPCRKYFDFMALKYLIEGIKLMPESNPLLYTLSHPGIKHNLDSYFKVKFINITEETIDSIVTKEKKIIDEINKMRTDKSFSCFEVKSF